MDPRERDREGLSPARGSEDEIKERREGFGRQEPATAARGGGPAELSGAEPAGYVQ